MGKSLYSEEVFNETLKGSEEHIIGNWRKGNLPCIVTESLALLWPVENVPNELGDMAKV